MLRSLVDALRRWLYLSCLGLAGLRTLYVDRHGWRDWLRDLAQRLGWNLPTLTHSIWIHGEGMGEFNAAQPLIERLRAACPDHTLVLTASRPLTLEWLAARYPGAVCRTLPWNLPGVVAHVFRRLNPHLLIALEFADGFCPGIVAHAHASRVPLMVVNGRLLPSPRPRRYDIAAQLGLHQQIIPFFDLFCLQNRTVQSALEAQGVAATRIVLTGNLKYDAQPQTVAPSDKESFRAALGIGSVPVLVAGCVHAEEERLILEVFATLRRQHRDLVLVLAPLNLGQVPALEALFSRRGFLTARRSQSQAENSAVILVDSYGELARCYALASVVLLGGSLTPQGAGHSLIEAAAQQSAIVVGPYTASQSEMVERFVEAKAVMQAAPAHLVSLLDQLLRNAALRAQLGQNARSCVEEGIGATERTWTALQALLPTAARVPRQHSAGWKSALKWLALTSVGQALLKLRAHRSEDWETLYHELGQPQTIMCLGNGPSAEDPRLWEMQFDCLFRVNWRWRLRSFLPHADLVFTGDYRTLAECPHSMLGFRTIEEETLLLMRSLSRWWFDRLPCMTLERMASFVNDTEWPARPTNGAVMVAAAVALQPRRLILAGLDLFAHPEGSYPGEQQHNRYAPMHARSVEIAIMRQALAEYRGELIVLSEPLRKALNFPEEANRRAA